MLARVSGRPEEELAFWRHSISYALENEEAGEFAPVAYGNLSDACLMGDRYTEALDALAESLRLGQRTGDRNSIFFVFSERSYALTMTGRWDEAIASFAEIPEEQVSANSSLASVLTGIPEIHIHRGDLVEARRVLGLMGFLENEIAVQDRAVHAAARAAVLYAEGRYEDALAAGAEAAAVSEVPQAEKQGLTWAVEAALALEQRERADELLKTVEEMPPGLRPPFLEAQAQRLRARMIGDPEGFKAAAGRFREYDIPFWLAVTLLEHGELTGDRALLDEARGIFEELKAAPWLERVDRATSSSAAATPA
jgi:tetratricopeptide (TPR) repeat protein